MKSKSIKTIFILLIILVTGIILYVMLPLLLQSVSPSGSGKTYSSTPASGKLDGSYSDYEDLLTTSPIIVIGESTGELDEITFYGVDFVVSSFKTEEIIRNEKYEGKKKTDKELSTIRVLQTVMQEDPIIEKGKKKLIFLRKYEGPVAEDVYVICGLYQGQFDLKKDKLIPVNPDDSDLERLDIPRTLEEALETIRNATYIPQLTPREIDKIIMENQGKTDEEIDEIIQEKKELREKGNY